MELVGDFIYRAQFLFVAFNGPFLCVCVCAIRSMALFYDGHGRWLSLEYHEQRYYLLLSYTIRVHYAVKPIQHDNYQCQ